jgi:hypothetical protein
MSVSARSLVETSRGATDRALSEIAKLMKDAAR